jgi:hypothetical protein
LIEAVTTILLLWQENQAADHLISRHSGSYRGGVKTADGPLAFVIHR